MKIALGTFACDGIESFLDSDLPSGVQAALSDYTQRIDAGEASIGLPSFCPDLDAPRRRAVDLAVDEHTWKVLTREAKRQGATVAQLAAHSVLVYLAELDRLTPPDGRATA